MKITLNKVEFEPLAVSEPMRDAIMAQPQMANATWRDVWHWDMEAQSAKTLVTLTQTGAVPLPNGLVFFVPKPGTEDAPQRADQSSQKMAGRILEAVGTRNPVELLRALAKVLMLPQKKLPLEPFAPLNDVASYTLKMHVDHSIVQMRCASRNLSFYMAVPGQVAFHADVTGVKDDEAYEALVAEKPELKTLQPRFLVPPRNRANRDIRAMALIHRARTLQAEAQQRQSGGEEVLPEALRMSLGMVQAELRMLAQSAQKQAPQQAKPKPIVAV
ncbi:hypothetical protein [Pseudoroseicyclus aestuarii]|uniref:Uncharacterized protein n=1 Tax=Pseudoroseicyclus aestuarii TaxID=1795041 RepID=A0A318SRL3_9RHOB|nr:hypothetical protein [Pseudoroseicyclus aestuarii]PYE84313.1 hypothetical protein DFP88_102110 [Pseudoroseicyclus aestuarii]